MPDGFFDLLGDHAAQWRQRMVRRRFSRDEVIFHEGDAGGSLHVIEKGRVLVEVSTAKGDVAALAVRGPGDVLGELAIIGDGRRTARVTTLEATETMAMDSKTLGELRNEDPRFDRFLVDLLANKLAEASTQLMEVLFVPVDKRVLRVVDRLTDSFDNGVTPIVVRIRQEDIAAMAGTRRQTANRPLKMAEAEGAILVRRGRIDVLDRDLLAQLAR